MNYSSVPNLPIFTEGTKTFKPQNEDQVKLYYESKDANRTSFIYSGLFGFLLICSLILIIAVYLICWIAKIDIINKYIMYVIIGWIISLLIILYQSNKLYNKHLDLRQQVNKMFANQS